jgi:hypothetical protein
VNNFRKKKKKADQRQFESIVQRKEVVRIQMELFKATLHKVTKAKRLFHKTGS